MSEDAEFERALDCVARTMLIGKWEATAIHQRLRKLVAGKQPWLRVLANECLQVEKKPKLQPLKQMLHRSEVFQSAYRRVSKLRHCVPPWEVAVAKIARQLLETKWDQKTLSTELARLVGKRQKWVSPLTTHLVAEFPGGCDEASLARTIVGNPEFIAAFERYASVRATADLVLPPRMSPVVGAPRSWRVPQIVSPVELAQWFAVPINDLLWLADGRSEFRRNAKAQHYRYRWSRKRTGGYRLIEAPKARLKQIQRDITHGILAKIPSHGAAHGFCEGRNIKTYASPHIDQDLVLRMDLKDFFNSVQRGRVQAIFRTAGYPGAVAELLSLLCTVRTPRSALEDAPLARGHRDAIDWDLYQSAHLPQGAPSSPSLANLSAYSLDRRLSGLAQKFNANYTRYADDLLFSGAQDFAKSVKRFHVFVLAVILDEGFQIQPRKTRMMRRGVSQKAAGLVLNDKVNTPRRDYERLKAILHNCAKGDPESQNHAGHENFRLHLLGLVGFHQQINPRRGKKLLAAFQRAFPNDEHRRDA